MAARTPKSLCRRLAGSLALAAALLVALTCGAGYWLTARTVLADRSGTLALETASRAKALEDTVKRQAGRLGALADALRDPALQADPALAAGLLADEERANGNLTNLRAVLGEMIYADGEAAEITEPADEEWYRQGARGLSYLTQETVAVLTIALPIPAEEGQAGVLAADFPLNGMLQGISRITLFGGGRARLADENGVVISPPEISAVLRIPPGLRDGEVSFQEDNDGRKRYFAAAPVAGPGWKLVYAVDRRTLLKPLDPVLWLTVLAAAASAGMAALLAAWRMEALAEPLREMIRAAGEMEKGRYKVRVSYGADDEFGKLCRALEAGCAWTSRRIDELSHTMNRMAQGDFTVKSDGRYTGDFASIGEAIDRIAGALHDVFRQVNLTAKWALGGSHQVSGVSGRLSAGIESQSNSVDALGKAATLMRHESNQNALNASRAQEGSLAVGAELRECARQTQLLGGHVKEAEAAFRELDGLLETARKNVAQGRMLSISASAEAERVADDTAAFVMAVDELRMYFVTAQKALQEAAGMAGGLRGALSRAEDGVRHTAEAVRGVTKKNGQTAEYLSRIASASQLQAQAAAKMSKEVSVISVVIQANTQLAEQFDYSSSAFSDQAKTLSNMAAVFYTKGEASEDEKSAPIIFDEDSGGFSVTEEK